jgi:hypothetical protein
MKVSYGEVQDAVRAYARGQMTYSQLRLLVAAASLDDLMELMIDLATETLAAYRVPEQFIRRPKMASKNDASAVPAVAIAKGGA